MNRRRKLGRQAPQWKSDVAVVHRPRHDDWTLPKGKLEPGESWRDAARREVREETGCEAALGGLLRISRYAVPDGEKTVLFYDMLVVREGERIGDEVNELAWLSADEALEMLTYEQERRLIVEQTHMREQQPRRPRFRLPAWLSVGAPNRERLQDELRSYRARLEFRIEDTLSQAPAPPGGDAWANSALNTLRQAELAYERGEIDTGWELLTTAQRLEVFGLHPTALTIKAASIRKEAAEKLGSSWRHEAIKRILPDEDERERRTCMTKLETPTSPHAEHVYSAAALLDEHHRNEYRRLALRRNQLYALFLSLVVVAAGLGAWVYQGWIGTGEVLASWQTFSTVAWLGALGGALSAVTTTARATKRSRIPQILGDVPAAILRPFIGACSAVVGVIFLQAGLLNDDPGGDKILPIAVAAGFSEQFIVRAIETTGTGSQSRLRDVSSGPHRGSGQGSTSGSIRRIHGS